MQVARLEYQINILSRMCKHLSENGHLEVFQHWFLE